MLLLSFDSSLAANCKGATFIDELKNEIILKSVIQDNADPVSAVHMITWIYTSDFKKFLLCALFNLKVNNLDDFIFLFAGTFLVYLRTLEIHDEGIPFFAYWISEDSIGWQFCKRIVWFLLILIINSAGQSV